MKSQVPPPQGRPCQRLTWSCHRGDVLAAPRPGLAVARTTLPALDLVMPPRGRPCRATTWSSRPKDVLAGPRPGHAGARNRIFRRKVRFSYFRPQNRRLGQQKGHTHASAVRQVVVPAPKGSPTLREATAREGTFQKGFFSPSLGFGGRRRRASPRPANT